MSAKAIATVEALEGKVSYYFLSGAHVTAANCVKPPTRISLQTFLQTIFPFKASMPKHLLFTAALIFQVSVMEGNNITIHGTCYFYF